MRHLQGRSAERVEQLSCRFKILAAGGAFLLLASFQRTPIALDGEAEVEGGMLHGLVLQPDGSPAGDATVRVADAPFTEYSATTDVNGRFAIPWSGAPFPLLLVRDLVPGLGPLATRDFVSLGSAAEFKLAPTHSRVLFPCASLLAETRSHLPPQPVDVALGDLNGDENLDLVFLDRVGSLTIGLGRGDGTFAVGPTYPTGTSPTWVALGDLDEDGALDVAVSHANGSEVAIRPGHGDGTFGPEWTIPTPGARPREVQLIDVNGDKHLDVVLALAFVDSVQIAYGRGDGTVSGPVRYPTGGSGNRVAVGDVNHDGQQDLAIGFAGPDRGISILLNRGHAALPDFVPPSIIPTDEIVTGVALGDVTHDGRVDLVAVDRFWLRVLEGDGSGRFSEPSSVFIYGEEPAVELHDVDLDSELEIIVTNSHEPIERPDAVLVFQIGSGDDLVPTRFEVGEDLSAVAIGDTNRDGYPDYVVSAPFRGAVTSFLNDGLGGMIIGRSVPTLHRPRDVLVDHVDMDTHADLVVPTSFDLRVFRGNGDGSFRSASILPVQGLSVVRSVDITGDGVIDLIGSPFGGFGDLWMWRGLGDGTFASPMVQQIDGAIQDLIIADFTGDDVLDLLVLQPTVPNHLEIFLMRGLGGGSFDAPVGTGIEGHTLVMTSGDLNQDQSLDLAVGARFDNIVRAYLGNGDGTFSRTSSVLVPGIPANLTIGNFDSDAHLDVVAALRDLGAIQFLSGDGAGGLTSSALQPVDDEPIGFSFVDVDGDGLEDLIVGHLSPTIAILFSEQDGTLGAPAFFDTYSDGSHPAIADLDEDGIPEVVVPRRSDEVLIHSGSKSW